MKARGLSLHLFVSVAAALAAYSLAAPAPTGSPVPTPVWDGLLQRTPYPNSTPLPVPEPSAVDGVFRKLDPGPLSCASCRRCPSYPPVGEEWRLQLDRGVFRVYYAHTGWPTLGSFALEDDRILFFNDPHCFDTTGSHTWRQEDNQLLLDTISDSCGAAMRARAFSNAPWIRERPAESVTLPTIPEERLVACRATAPAPPRITQDH